MISPNSDSRLPPSDFVTLSRCGFAFWWLVILGVHLVSALFTAYHAKFYWGFENTNLSDTLRSYQIKVPRERSRIIASVHIVLSAIHGVYLLLMVGGSLWQRTLSFYPWSSTRHHLDKEHSTDPSHCVLMEDKSQPQVPVALVAAFRRMEAVYTKVASRHGLFGVNGKHFYVILISREIVETSFQTLQAFRMSKYLADRVVNHLYICLLVMNCWSSVFVSTRMFGKDEARRRFTCIVCDCALDLVSAMGVTVLIALRYVGEYDVDLSTVTEFKGNEWVAEMLNEVRLVMVMSWSDLVARVIFFLGVIATTASMKKLLRWTPGRINCNQTVVNHDALFFSTPWKTKVTPVIMIGKETTCKRSPLVTHCWKRDVLDSARTGHLLMSSIHVCFVAWGFLILILHILASLKSPLLECSPKVHPMKGALPSCFVVEFNCHEVGITGIKDEMVAEWSKFDLSTVFYLHIRHCPALEIPEMFQRFNQIREIWVYNSTIVDWGDSVAVTKLNHPTLYTIGLVRTNMTGGLLPLGFQSQDFPINLSYIYMCETNLQSLPNDLDSKWHTDSSIYLENSKLTSVSPALVRLKPTYLALSGNPITDLPLELLSSNTTLYIVLRRTNIRELPEHVTLSDSLSYLDVTDTGISFFWWWIDSFLENNSEGFPRLAAGGSTYCNDLDNIMNGVSTAFSAPFQTGYSRILMNASKENWELLGQYVDCSPPFAPTETLLEMWDGLYGLVEENA